MITFSFLNQTLWCDPHWNRLSETIPMSGHTLGFGWEIRKLEFWKLSILDLICCPGHLLEPPDLGPHHLENKSIVLKESNNIIQVFLIITLSFLYQNPIQYLNRSNEKTRTNGHTIRFCWEIKKTLAFKICSKFEIQAPIASLALVVVDICFVILLFCLPVIVCCVFF